MQSAGMDRNDTVKGVNHNFLKPSQKQWDIMLAVASGRPRPLIAREFDVSGGYVSQIATLFGVGQASPRSSLVHRDRSGALLCIGSVAIEIDDADAEEIARYSWHLDRNGYACSTRFKKLHRWLVGAEAGQIVDHIDGNLLNCRRSNLRIVTRAQNNQNKRRVRKSQIIFKGVRQNGLNWSADINVGGVPFYIGTYGNPIKAALAYDDAARAAFGACARLNFPDHGEQSALYPEEIAALNSIIFTGVAA